MVTVNLIGQVGKSYHIGLCQRQRMLLQYIQPQTFADKEAGSSLRGWRGGSGGIIGGRWFRGLRGLQMRGCTWINIADLPCCYVSDLYMKNTMQKFNTNVIPILSYLRQMESLVRLQPQCHLLLRQHDRWLHSQNKNM